MRRLAALCMILCFAAALTGCGDAGTHADIRSISDYRDIPFVTQEEIDAIEQLKAENEGFSYGHLLETESFMLPDGTFTGFTIDVYALFSRLFGIEFTPRYFEDRHELARTFYAGETDFSGSVGRFAGQDAQVLVSSSLGGRDVNIYTSEHGPAVDSSAALAGLTVGFLEGDTTKALIVGEHSHLSVMCVDVPDVAQAAEMLKNGEIDAFIVDSAADPQFERYGFIRGKKLFWPAFAQAYVSTANSALEPIISVINKYLAAGGTSVISELYENGNTEYKKYKLEKSYTDEEKAYLAALAAGNAPVYIALESDNYPFSFYNVQDSRFEGVAVDVLEEVSRLTGIRFENIADETTAWTEILENLKSGKVSLVSHLVYSDERAKSYIWSTIPFSVDSYTLISKLDFPQVKSHEIPSLKTGAFINSIYADMYTHWFPGSTNLVLYQTASESYDALERGEIDLVIGADFMLLAQTNFREKLGYVVNYRFDETLESAFGFNQNETVLRSIVDKALAHMELDPISDYWNSRVFDYTAKMEKQKMSYITASAVVLLIALAAMSGLFFNNQRLTKNLRSRTVTLSDARQSLQTILDTVPLPIGILNKETHEIVYGNDGFLDILELETQRELRNLKLADILRPSPPNDTEADVEKLLRDTERQVVGNVRLISSKNNVTDVRMHVRWSDYEGRRSAIAIMVDLTAENEHRQMLMAAAENEKEANRAKSLFLANMSHEIRTPMNGIIGLTDLLLNEDISGRQLQYVKDIKTSSESLLGIINDILDISKVSAGKLKITPVDTDLSIMLNNIVSMIGFSARVKGLSFIDDIRVDSPEYVRLDDVRVRQIIINLLSNAVKFTQEGYVKLSAWIEGGEIIFEVRDTGIGIKPENMSTIFGAFEQVDAMKNRKIQGTGLGLSITKSLVELMGGTISVQSEYGAGTTFTVAIPYEPGDGAAVARPGSEVTYLSAPDARVLLVDDIQINLTVGAGMLRLCGITSSLASSGAEAVELVRHNDYDLIFMDHMMPEMDGVEATMRIRALGRKYKKLPIIALTANAMNESRDLLLKSGMDDFISKPIDMSAFVDVLRKWLPPEKIKVSEIAAAVKSDAYSATLDAAARISGLEIEQALSRIGGLQEVLEASLKQASRSIDGKLRRMDECFLGGDFQGFAMEAHGLKGMLASIGATYNSELAAQLESAAKARDAQLCASKLPEFVSNLEILSLDLKALFTTQQSTQKPKGDEELLARRVSEAIALLEDFEAVEAVERLRQLEVYSYEDRIEDILQNVLGMIEAFDYDSSIAALKSI